MESAHDNQAVERTTRHYLQGSTIKEIMVGPDPRDGNLVALVVPDLEHFRKTGETDIWGEVQWHLEYYSQQLPPSERIRDFVLTNQDLSGLSQVKPSEVATLFRQLSENRRHQSPSASAAALIFAAVFSSFHAGG